MVEKRIKKYVLCVCTTKDKVVLLRKDRPEYLAGKISFPGGKMEQDDWSAYKAAAREVDEEIGVHTTPDQWEQVGYFERPGDWIVYVFRCENEDFLNARQMETEEVYIVEKNKVHEYGPWTENALWIWHYTQSADINRMFFASQYKDIKNANAAY